METKRKFSWKRIKQTLFVSRYHRRFKFQSRTEENFPSFSNCSCYKSFSNPDDSISEERTASEETRSKYSRYLSYESQSEEEIVLFDRTLVNDKVPSLDSVKKETDDNQSLSSGYVLPNPIFFRECLGPQAEIAKIENNTIADHTYIEVYPEDWNSPQENNKGKFKKFLQLLNCCKKF